jgi:gluconokinase
LIILLYGVSGCGKSTVGRLLAAQLNWIFLDADDYHSAANIEKMRNGTPLNDADRWPWLDLLAAKLTELQAQGQSAVLACSALKPAYRQRLGVDECHVRSVLLTGSPALLAARLALRQHAFMAASLLQSQLVTLEPSAASLMVDINQSPEAIIHSMIETLHLDQDSAS